MMTSALVAAFLTINHQRQEEESAKNGKEKREISNDSSFLNSPIKFIDNVPTISPIVRSGK